MGVAVRHAISLVRSHINYCYSVGTQQLLGQGRKTNCVVESDARGKINWDNFIMIRPSVWQPIHKKILTCSFFSWLFVQNQEATMHENVGYITKLIANYCVKGLSHYVLRPTGVNLFTFCSLPDINVLLWTFIVRHGDILTVVIDRHFQLLRVRDAHLCVNGSPEWCFSFANASCLIATCHSNLGDT